MIGPSLAMTSDGASCSSGGRRDKRAVVTEVKSGVNCLCIKAAVWHRTDALDDSRLPEPPSTPD